MPKSLATSPIAAHIVNALKAVHDQRETSNIQYVRNIEKKLAGRTDLGCIVYINQLDSNEVTVLANRMKTEAAKLSQAAETLRCFY